MIGHMNVNSNRVEHILGPLDGVHSFILFINLLLHTHITIIFHFFFLNFYV